MMKRNLKTALVGGSALALLVGVMSIPALAAVGRKTAALDYNNMSVTLNGKKLDLRDNYGNPIEPFTMNGTTYLPVASVSQALGVNVAWDDQTKTVVLTSGSYTIPDGNGIGEQRAREIALKHAGLTAAQVSFVRVEPDWDDGRLVYDVEFYTGTREYDYEIDGATGAVLSVDQDIESYVPSTPGTGSYIGEQRAKQIVEQKAGTTGVYREFKSEWDDGRMVYEGELFSAGKSYEFTIDAVTGSVLEWDVDWD